MRIVLSEHARRRIDERGVTELSVYLAIFQPDEINFDRTERNRYMVKKIITLPKKKRKVLLLVIYELDKDELMVITVIQTSKIDKYLKHYVSKD